MSFPLSRKVLLLSTAVAMAVVPAALISTRSFAATTAEQEDDGPGSGTLMLQAKGVATSLPAVRLGTDMDVTVSGTVARVRVTQAFRNTSNQWVEATYLYPLPEDGAVDSLKMVVGQRVIIGKIKQREEARQTYEAAKAKGQKAGLVEQQRPNMFTNSVANVGPGETVLISIEYQAPVRQLDGKFSLRLPLVVGPRYVPPHSLTSTAAVSYAQKVTAAPVLDPQLGEKLNPVSITVQLAPGFEPANLISAYHRIAIDGSGEQRRIRLVDSEVPADRDFELSWRSAAANPTVGLYRQHLGNHDYVMASVMPPAPATNLVIPPREMVFVIDNSGSMGGESMQEAKASLVHALGTLRPQDRFNVIRFDDTMTQLFEHSVAATPDQVQLATRFAQGLEAAGGTEMLPALKAALADAAASGDAATVRQIVFLTDGDLSNEDEMSAAIAADGGRSRIFLIGIGSAPNNYLMNRMAVMGRGTYTNIGSPGEVVTKTTALLDVLQRPAVQNLKATVNGTTLELTPNLLPDLYVGQPLVLLGRTDKLAGSLTISGTLGKRLWSSTVNLADAIESPAIAKLWARRKIDDIETDRTRGKIEGEAADKAITVIGLEHSLVTSQTSLVAVDETPSRPAGATLTREELPINLPAGWKFDTLFGGDAAKAAADNAAHPSTENVADPAEAIELPQTATDFERKMITGLALLLFVAGGLTMLRRRTVTA